LGEFGRQYKSRPTIKSQALTDFIIEYCFTEYINVLNHSLSATKISIKPKTSMGSTQILIVWKLYVDDASNMNRSGAGIVLISSKEHVLQYGIHFEFPTTNNVAVYKALIVRQHLPEALKPYPLQAHSDSQLGVSQCQGTNETREPNTQRYLQKVKPYFNVDHQTVSITCIPKENNQRVDLLSNLASSNLVELPAGVWIEILKKMRLVQKSFSPIIKMSFPTREILYLIRNT
jgi:ribonuclease HI